MNISTTYGAFKSKSSLKKFLVHKLVEHWNTHVHPEPTCLAVVDDFLYIEAADMASYLASIGQLLSRSKYFPVDGTREILCRDAAIEIIANYLENKDE